MRQKAKVDEAQHGLLTQLKDVQAQIDQFEEKRLGIGVSKPH
jgi:hypothetical protein